MEKLILISCLLMVAAIAIYAQQNEFPKLTSPYLGQKPPAELPEAFAPSIIFCENADPGNIAFSPDGKYSFYYSEGKFYWMDAGIIEDLKPTGSIHS